MWLQFLVYILLYMECFTILIIQLRSIHIVQQALKTSGLKDDTTCVVVDIIPSDHSSTPPSLSPKKNQNKLRSLLFGRRSHSSVGKLGNKSASFDSVEELFEEGSAMLDERHASFSCCSSFCYPLFSTSLCIINHSVDCHLCICYRH